ncbi:MAG: hypothetical protein KatS3mg114_1358 [Planctomycetaceae bacterium]|nr:MAG: hypothetical protein KatS3mg114_1358 [Planctomycetaceae bacterium]
MADREYTRYQLGIIKRYYENRDQIDQQRLGELATELFLASGKKRSRLWETARQLMLRLHVPASRVEHVCRSDNPALLAEVVQDLHKGLIRPPAPPPPQADATPSE